MMRRSLGWLLILALALTPLAGPRAARSELVRWTDEKGEAHIGELDDVPDRYKKFAKPLGTPEEATAPACLAAKDAPKGGAKIRFKPNEGGRIYVWACINGKGPVALILDIGAFATIIREPVLKGFGVEFTERMIGHGGVGFGEVSRLAKLESLQVEGARVAPLYVVSTNDTRFTWEQHGGHFIVGLLGQDFLKQFLLDIDNQRGMVVMTPKNPASRGKAAQQAPSGAPKAK